MAVKIIDETPDPSVVKRIICRKCGVKLEYLPIDVQTRNTRDIDGGSGGSTWIICPKCNNEVSISVW